MTAVAIARAALAGVFARDARLASILPELRGTFAGDRTIEHLLAHRAGLEPHVVLYEPMTRGLAVDPAEALATAARARRSDALGEAPPWGYPPVYSDVGYLLAGTALARAMGVADAGDAIDALVVTPLGLGAELGSARVLEARGVDVVGRTAPTEEVGWRGGVVRGRVHDENAWAISGAGASGHAGMFGTVRAVLDFACAVASALDDEPCALGTHAAFAWLVEPRPGGTLRAGFDGKSAEGSSAGTRAGARTFGHLGFTGTSLWIDPDARAVVVLLTNRVHPSRENVAIRAARPIAHDALFARAAALTER
jgi:CubicO group peptidase (beta-lactamase class C family)